MPAKADTSIFGEEDIFRLKVSEIVYSVLKERDLTINEVNKIKQAIKESLDLVFAQHAIECRSQRDKEVSMAFEQSLRNQQVVFDNHMAELADDAVQEFERANLMTIISSKLTDFQKNTLAGIIESKFTAYQLKISEDASSKRESELKESKSHTYRVIGVAFGLLGIFLTVLQIILKSLGYL